VAAAPISAVLRILEAVVTRDLLLGNPFDIHIPLTQRFGWFYESRGATAAATA